MISVLTLLYNTTPLCEKEKNATAIYPVSDHICIWFNPNIDEHSL